MIQEVKGLVLRAWALGTFVSQGGASSAELPVLLRAARWAWLAAPKALTQTGPQG